MSVRFNTGEVIRSLEEGIMRAIVRGTESVKTEAINMVQSGPKTGRVYRRRGIEHQASAPGQAPASDTGHLVQSIHTEYNRKNLEGYVVVTADYARALEFGTENIEPRPFLRPAVSKKAKAIIADVEAEIRRWMK